LITKHARMVLSFQGESTGNGYPVVSINNPSVL
jgi:hypothetical protein